MSRARIPVLAVAVLLPLLVLAALVVRPVPADPTDAPVVLVADPIVAGGLLDVLESDGDRTLEVLTGTTIQSARQLVEDGIVIAAVRVDLESASDVLYVAGANGSQVNDPVVTAITDLLDTFDRDVAVLDVHPADVPVATPGILVGTGLVLGVVLMLVRQWGARVRRGARPPRHLAERIGTDALLYGVTLGLAAVALGLPGSPPLWIVLGTAVLVAAATITATAVRTIGPWGLGVVAALFLLPIWVLVRAPHPLLLPAGFEAVGQWMPHGAAAEITQRMALFGDAASTRPWIVLLGWAVAGALALALTRRAAPTEPAEPAAIEG